MNALVVTDELPNKGELFEIHEIREDGWILTEDGKMFRSEAVELLPSKTELSYQESQDLLHLERKVERSFYEAGKALKEIRDRALYRNLYPKFEDYVVNRFKCGRRYADYQIQASDVVDDIAVENNCSQLPKSESQCRPLTPIEREHRNEIWLDAIALADGELPTAKQVKLAVKDWLENNRKPIPNNWNPGDICTVVGDIPKRKKRWCVVIEVNNFTCTCQDWEGQFQAKPEELNEFLTRTSQSKKEMGLLCDRLIRLSKREGLAKTIVNQLGRIDRDFLTDEEDRILSILEGK